ncbi:MAG: DegT/DnrJ/EryC1/StrS family aminotransferase [Planctomycetes bacterium]|nr:DegT/DnrJ/EryC1/StrS family aminotransferase [Planctomycetota bacterium]
MRAASQRRRGRVRPAIRESRAARGGGLVGSVVSYRFPREFPGVHFFGPEERDAVLRVIERRSPFRYYGPEPPTEVASLEREVAESLGRKHAQAVASGTAAVSTALAALGVGPGQEVLVPGFLWVATVGAVVRSGAIPVLVEVDDTFGMDPLDLEAKITRRSRVVIPIHMCGTPADMPQILDVARRYGLRVLEDCAQANGAWIGDRPVGSFGDMSIFSFQLNKNITSGEGGIVVTDDDDLARRANAAHDLGVQWVDGTPDYAGPVAMWGQGTRMGELAAAVARAQLPKLPAIVRSMRESKARIRRAIEDRKDISWRGLATREGDTGSFLLPALPDEVEAQRLANELAVRGIVASWLRMYGLHIYSNIRALVERRSNSPDGFPWTHPANAGSHYEYGPGALPRTDDLFARGVVVAVPSRMTAEDEQAFIDAFREACDAAGVR